MARKPNSALLTYALIAGLVVIPTMLYALGSDAPRAGTVALDLQPAQNHTLEYVGPLDDGASLQFLVRGDEDPWNVKVRFKGGPNGVANPRLGTTMVPGELVEDQETAAFPLAGLRMSDNDLKARADAGSFYVQLSYEEGRVPHVDRLEVTPDGVLTEASDPNAPSGDRVVRYEYAVKTASGALVYGPSQQESSLLRYIPTEPGAYSVSVRVQDTRGAWSVTIARQFNVIGTLAGSGGEVGVREGEATITAPAIDQQGNPVFEAIRPGGGPGAFGKKVLFGGIVLVGCAGACDDPFTEGWIAKVPKLRDWLIEVVS